MISLVICPLRKESLMSKNIKGNGHHLTLSDRTYIEQELLQRSTARSIAAFLGKDPSTISKEIKLHRIPGDYYWKLMRTCDKCKHFSICPRAECMRPEHYYLYNDPARHCSDYDPFTCPYLNKYPYVCNGCDKRKKCSNASMSYSAVKAQKQYEKLLVDSRKGINVTKDELWELNELISPLILKGQPLSHIFAVHADEIPVCRRTLYNYLDQRVFQARNIDLPRRVRYKKRKKRSEPAKRNIQQVYRNKRTYKDFEKFTAGYPDLNIVEMDTVKGSREKGKCLLTLLFRSCSFMLVILLPTCTQSAVVNAINDLTDTIGLRLFRKYFGVILTDNGSEFKNPWDIETTLDGKHRTYVFYCDPYVSNQKGRLEKNHEYIRYIIPKGRSMNRYTQEDINLMASHINSTARDSLNGASPFDLADILIDKRIPMLLGQFKIPGDKVCLKPYLVDGSVASRESAKDGGKNE